MLLREVARSLRAGGDPARAANQLLDALASASVPCLDDVAVLAERLSRTSPLPSHSFFASVARHFEAELLASGCGEQKRLTVTLKAHKPLVSAAGAVLLADAFARSRFAGVDCERALGVTCLAVPPTAVLAAPEVLRFAVACCSLGAQHDPGVRSFLRLRAASAARFMQPSSLAECSAQLAKVGVYSHEVSAAIDRELTANPWAFNNEDVKRLLPHFAAWRLGPLQKRAFQSLGNRLCEIAECLSAEEALEAIDCFTQVGNVHELLLQHLNHQLFVNRNFTELPACSIAKLVKTMSLVEYYHTALLSDIASHLVEDFRVVASWGAVELSSVLRCLALASVKVPATALRFLGCRYASILPGMSEPDLRDFMNVAASFPELIRTVLRRGGAPHLSEQLANAWPVWGAIACADTATALVLALDMSIDEKKAANFCACMSGGGPHESGFHTRSKFHPRREVARQTQTHKTCRAVWAPIAEPGRGRKKREKMMASARAMDSALSLLTETVGHLEVALFSGGALLAETPGSTSLSALLEKLPTDGGWLVAAGNDLIEDSRSATPTTRHTELHLLTSDRTQNHPALELLDGNLRRSELLEVAAQTAVSLRLGFGPGAPKALARLPASAFYALCRLENLISHLLRPRRSEDRVVQQRQMGPFRLEAFVHRPNEPAIREVYRTIQDMIPFIPRLLGWAASPARRQDYLQGEPTGGALTSLRREVEVTPFVVCVVLQRL